MAGMRPRGKSRFVIDQAIRMAKSGMIVFIATENPEKFKQEAKAAGLWVKEFKHGIKVAPQPFIP